MVVNNLYNSLLIDHYHNPRNYGKLEDFDFQAESFNPLCGDKIELTVKLFQGKVRNIGFTAEGCIISLATASILFENALNQNLETFINISIDEILKLINLNLGPNRLKCALLSLESLKSIYNSFNNAR